MASVSATDQLLKEIRLRRARPDATKLLPLRKGLGIKQPSLAEFMDVSVMSISEWERGLKYPSPRHWKRLNELVELLEAEACEAA